MPTREMLLAEARQLFLKTKPLDEIVERGYRLLAEAVSALLFVPPLWTTATPQWPVEVTRQKRGANASGRAR